MDMFKNLNFSSKIVVCMGIYLVIFSQEVLVLILLGKAEPSTLIISTFAAFGVEGGVLGWIKHVKVKRGEK